MSLVCFGSQKGSPGTTLTALAVAAAWPREPDERVLFVEADPAGGSLAVRYGLTPEPGLVALAAGLRAGLDPDDVWTHAQTLPGGLAAVIAPDGPDQVAAALGVGGGSLTAFLSSLPGVTVIADVGRVGPESPSVGFASAADVVAFTCRPIAEHLHPTARRMQTLAPRFGAVGWVLVGAGHHSAAEVEAAYGFDVLGVIPEDRRGADGLTTGSASAKMIRRSPLVRAASTLAAELASTLSTSLDPVGSEDGDGGKVGETQKKLAPLPPGPRAERHGPEAADGTGDVANIEPRPSTEVPS